jgi:hypothetical protein
MNPVGAIRRHGVLLESARGPVPNLVELVAGQPIQGSWWSHPQSHEIFDVINRAAESPAVARTRLLGGKVTLVHRRLWPALYRLADRFPDGVLDAVSEEHTPSGAHRKVVIPFPDWLPTEVRRAGAALTEDEARRLLPKALTAQLSEG